MADINDLDNLTPEQIKEIIRERDEAKRAVDSTVEEIKSMRKTKQELETAKQELEKKLSESATPKNDTPDVGKLVEEKVKEQLSEKEKLDAKLEYEAAFAEFVSKNPEFDPENDKTGLRAEVFKRELSKFNMNGARKKEDFLSTMTDAISLLYRKENREYVNPFASTSSRNGGSKIEHETSGLTPREKETMSRLGWDMKKMNDMKLKHPELYESVFNAN